MNTLRGIPGRSLTYNIEDQLVSVGGTTYAYNSDGYLYQKIGGGTTNYTYSTRGELLTATLPDTRVISYVYDPLGRRIAKRINGTTTEKYLWAGLTRLLAVYDGSNNLIMRFAYADGRMPVSMTRSGSTYYLSYDQVGTLRAVYNASGSIVKRVDYDSFGNILTDTAPTFTMPFGFAGGLQDRDTGLVHFGYRDYDPATGRWTAKDPIGFSGGLLNLYGYCLEDPVNFIDPYGLMSLLRIPKPSGPLPPRWTPEWQWRYPEVGKHKDIPRWYDPYGRAWRWHPKDESHPLEHWDYNPHDTWESPYENIFFPEMLSPFFPETGDDDFNYCPLDIFLAPDNEPQDWMDNCASSPFCA